MVCIQSGVHWVLFSLVFCVFSRRGGRRIGRENSFCGLSLSCKKCYRLNITFLSVLYHDCIKTFCKERHFTQEGKRKTPPYGSPAAAEIKGLGERKSSQNCPGCPCVFCRLFQKRLSSSVCSIISSTLQCRMLHSLSMVLVCTFLFFRNLSSWERFTLWYV